MSIFRAILRAPGRAVEAAGGVVLKVVPGGVKRWVVKKVAGAAASRVGGVLRDQVTKEKTMSDQTTPKPGYKTTEFWLTVVAQLVGFAYMSGAIGAGTPIDHLLGLIVSMLLAAGYTVSRGASKIGEPSAKPGYKTTEFWMTVLSTALTVATSSGLLVAGSLVEKVVGVGVTLLGLLGYHVSRGLAKGNQAGITIETFGDSGPAIPAGAAQ